MADAFFTSAFGGIADMAGSAAGLVAVGNSPNRTSTCQLGGANEANQFYCESIHRSSWDQLGRLTLRLDFVCRVPDIKLSAATMTRNPLVLHADRGSVVAKKAALAFDPKVFLAVVGSGKTISHYRKGEAIFAQGDPGDAVFFIEKGRVKVTVVSQQGKEAIIAFLGPGDFIGEGCLGSRTRRISTASATTECVITRVEKSTMMKTLREEPKFAELFTSHLLARAIRVEDDLIDQPQLQ